uniref:Uncharacterized protein n=1 Tax=Romanomermis culicivorax TaxID=13658 RepID=A0A915K9U4_ROMCU
MENSSENSDDEHRRHPSSGRSTSRLSSLEYLGTVAAASEIIDLGAYANVIECSRLQAPDPNFHPYLLASNSDSENFSNLQPCVSVVRKQSPNRNENQLSGNYIPIDKSSCSVPYQNVVPFHRMIWNSDRNDPVNHPENVPSYNNSEKNYQESTSRHSISAYSDISEKSRVYSSVQTYDQSRQNLTTGSKGPEKESLRWPQQIKESLKNCDDSSIKLLADACLISHERQSFKFLEEPFLGLIDMQEISSFDRELTNIDDKQKSEGEDFSNYYSDCCEFNAVICHRTVDDQDANNKNESNMRDIFVMNNESSDAILPSYSEIYRTYTRDAVSRSAYIPSRLDCGPALSINAVLLLNCP